MNRGILIGATLADFMEGTNFSQSHFSHSEVDRINCYDCQELTPEQYQETRAIYIAASKQTRFVPTDYQLAELMHVADMCQDTLANTGDFKDAGRAATVRRSMDSWAKMYATATEVR